MTTTTDYPNSPNNRSFFYGWRVFYCHRLFALLTEQTMGFSHRIDAKGKEELMVAVGLILDLCKNAPLDEDERQLCGRRLDKVAIELASGSGDFYARDMIKLAKKRLLQQ